MPGVQVFNTAFPEFGGWRIWQIEIIQIFCQKVR